MKKWITVLVIIVLILLVAGFALPYFMGRLVENKYSQVISTIPSSDRLRVKVASYQRKWFSSDVKLEVVVKVPIINKHAEGTGSQKLLASTLYFIVDQHIQHGPFIFAQMPNQSQFMVAQAFINSSIHLRKPALQLPNTTSTAISPAGNAATQLTQAAVTTVVKLNGDIVNDLNIPLVSYDTPQEGIIYNIKNITSHTEFTGNLRKINGQLNVGAFNFESPGFKQQMQSLVFNYDLTKTPEGLFAGEKKTQISQLSWSYKGSQYILRGIDLDLHSTAANNKANYTINVKLNAAIVDNMSYGPNSLTLAFSNVDVPTLLLINQQRQKLQSTVMDRQSLAANYSQLLLALFSKGMHINLKNLNVATSYGAVVATGDILFPSQPTATANPLAVLAGINATIGIRIPQAIVLKALVSYHTWANNREVVATQTTAAAGVAIPSTDPQQQALQQLTGWIQNGWLAADADHYVFNLSYKENRLLINNKPLNIPQAVAKPQAPVPMPNAAPGQPAQPQTVQPVLPAPAAIVLPPATHVQ